MYSFRKFQFERKTNRVTSTEWREQIIVQMQMWLTFYQERIILTLHNIGLNVSAFQRQQQKNWALYNLISGKSPIRKSFQTNITNIKFNEKCSVGFSFFFHFISFGLFFFRLALKQNRCFQIHAWIGLFEHRI